VSELTADEQAAMLQQFVEAGLVQEPRNGPAFLPAEVADE
jgi:hypothetical protein